MKKEEIYVVIDDEEKRLRAIQILTDAGEKVSKECSASKFSEKYKYLRIDDTNKWYIFSFIWRAETEITLDQLEELLNPKEIKLDALKLIAESYGFELVEKKREIKVGDFGKFSSENRMYTNFGFLKSIEITGHFIEETKDNCISSWSNFRHLTDEEKQAITENW